MPDNHEYKNQDQAASVESLPGNPATDEGRRAATTAEEHRIGARGPGFIATSIAAASLSLAASIAYFNYFPPEPLRTPPVMVVDTLHLAMSIARMAPNDITRAEALYAECAKRIDMLRAQGTIILEAGHVLMAPEELVLKPSDLIEGAPDIDMPPSFNMPDHFGESGTDADGTVKAIEELGKLADRLAESTNAMREAVEGGDASEGNTDGRNR